MYGRYEQECRLSACVSMHEMVRVLLLGTRMLVLVRIALRAYG
jgi:hypothetical protein